MQTKYKRILLKLSGEALAGEKNSVLIMTSSPIFVSRGIGVEIAIVVGGGIF